MISNQILQSTLEGFKNIGRLEFVVTDVEGAVLAHTCEIEGVSDASVEFSRMPAESMEAKGYQYFKIYDEFQLEYILVVEVFTCLLEVF